MRADQQLYNYLGGDNRLNNYPGGQLQPGMTWQNTLYRYAYNTQERSDELYGPGNFYTAQFWEYDTRIWRRWNRDPIESIGLSPYSTFLNNPIVMTDLFGASPASSINRAWRFLDKNVFQPFFNLFRSVHNQRGGGHTDLVKERYDVLRVRKIEEFSFFVDQISYTNVKPVVTQETKIAWETRNIRRNEIDNYIVKFPELFGGNIDRFSMKLDNKYIEPNVLYPIDLSKAVSTFSTTLHIYQSMNGIWNATGGREEDFMTTIPFDH